MSMLTSPHTVEPAIEQLESTVQRALAYRVRDLHIESNGAGLVLHGRAASYYIKQLAQQAVMAMTELPIYANCIEVT